MRQEDGNLQSLAGHEALRKEGKTDAGEEEGRHRRQGEAGTQTGHVEHREYRRQRKNGKKAQEKRKRGSLPDRGGVRTVSENSCRGLPCGVNRVSSERGDAFGACFGGMVRKIRSEFYRPAIRFMRCNAPLRAA